MILNCKIFLRGYWHFISLIISLLSFESSIVGMRNDRQRPQDAGVPRGRRGIGNNGFFSLRSLSRYLGVVSSGASSVSSTVRSAGASVASSAAAGNDNAGGWDQVHWAGFDKLECEGGALRQVLLLGYRSGFQAWDVEQGDDVRLLAASNDGVVSFLQMQKKPIALRILEDKFADVRPLLAVAVDEPFSSSNNGGVGSPCIGGGTNCQEPVNDDLLPTTVRFYSLRTHEYVYSLKFRSPVYSIRCSSRVVAVSQAAQIHCFNAATLEKEYTTLTSHMTSTSLGSGGIGYGPLALGSRWLAYSGSPVANTGTDRVSPEHLTVGTGLSPLSNGSLVVHYAKESSKQLAAGIVTLGDIGYTKLSKYLPDNNDSTKNGSSSFKTNGTISGQLPHTENIGMVIVRDVVTKSIVVQFRAHASPTSALAFDPSGTLLVTASIHGHNINVFRIMPSVCRSSSGPDATGTCIHLYRLQRGMTNAIIQDISFSNDSQWIMISSSRGTSHLFSISLSGGTTNLQFNDGNFINGSCGSDLATRSISGPSKLNHQSLLPSGSPITLSVISRIRNGSNGWKGAVSGAAAAATGRVSPLSGTIASVFHNCKSSGLYPDNNSSKNYYLLVFSPSGCIIQYVLRHSIGGDSGIDLSGLSTVTHGSLHGIDQRLVVEPLQKWDICHKHKRRDRCDNFDVYGEHGNGESNKLFQKGVKRGTSIYASDSSTKIEVTLSTKENHHMYVSEVELYMHTAQAPLWAKSKVFKIQFQMMVDGNIIMDDINMFGGEIEIERVPTRIIEARTKDLIPVFDYVQPHRIQQSRGNTYDTNRTGFLVRQKSSLSDDGKVSCRSSCSSRYCIPDSIAASDHSLGTGENCWVDFQSSTEANEGFVNSGIDGQNMKSQLEFVNNREGREMDGQLEDVYNKEILETRIDGYENSIG